MTTTEQLRRMGLVEAVDHPTHRPGKITRLTDAGRTITREQLRAAWARVREDYLAAREDYLAARRAG